MSEGKDYRVGDFVSDRSNNGSVLDPHSVGVDSHNRLWRRRLIGDELGWECFCDLSSIAAPDYQSDREPDA